MSKFKSALVLVVTLSLAAAVMMALAGQSAPVLPALPAGFTETPTPTDTPTPTETPTQTPRPTPTETPTQTPSPTQTETPTPPSTSTPTPAHTETPLPPATATTQPILLDPYINKQVNLEQAQVGDINIFTIDVINPNLVAISQVIVGDTLSPLVNYLSASVPRGTFSFDPAANTWTLTLGDMGPGERVTIQITARVSDRARPPDTLLNTASLASSRGVTQSNTTRTLIVPGQLPGTGRR